MQYQTPAQVCQPHTPLWDLRFFFTNANLQLLDTLTAANEIFQNEPLASLGVEEAEPHTLIGP